MPGKPAYEELEQLLQDLERTESKRKHTEDELRKSEIKHKILIHNIPGMVYRAYADSLLSG